MLLVYIKYIKKCGHRSNRTKNANSDSRQTISIRKTLCTCVDGICIFIKFKTQAEKGYSIPFMVVFFVFVCNYSLALSVYHKFGDFSRDCIEILSSRFDGVILKRFHANRNLFANNSPPPFAKAAKQDIMHSAKTKAMCSTK